MPSARAIIINDAGMCDGTSLNYLAVANTFVSDSKHTLINLLIYYLVTQ